MFMCPHVIEGKECECGYTKPEAEPCIKEQIEKHLQSTQYNSKKDSQESMTMPFGSQYGSVQTC